MLAKPNDHGVSETNNATTDRPTSNNDTFMTAKVSVVQSRQIRSMSLPTPPQEFLSSTQGLEQSKEHRRQQQQPINEVRTYLVLNSGSRYLETPGFRILGNSIRVSNMLNLSCLQFFPNFASKEL